MGNATTKMGKGERGGTEKGKEPNDEEKGFLHLNKTENGERICDRFFLRYLYAFHLLLLLHSCHFRKLSIYYLNMSNTFSYIVDSAKINAKSWKIHTATRAHNNNNNHWQPNTTVVYWRSLLDVVALISLAMRMLLTFHIFHTAFESRRNYTTTSSANHSSQKIGFLLRLMHASKRGGRRANKREMRKAKSKGIHQCIKLRSIILWM